MLLGVLAVVMGVNYVSASSRFLDANRAYDSLTLSLVDFKYQGPDQPVQIAIGVENPAGTSIEVLALRVTLRAGLQQVGGGEIRVDDILPAGASTTYLIDGRIDDRTYVSRLDPAAAIRWRIRGEIRVRLDQDVAPVWIRFAVETQSE